MPSALDTELVKPAGPNGNGPPDLGRDDHGGGGDGDEGSGDPRYVPGAGLLAMRFVLVSITVLFITVGIAYYLRSRSAINWQTIRVPRWLWLSTALILASSWTLESARASFERKAHGRYVAWMEITIGAGLAFLVSQLLGLYELVEQGIYLERNPHSSLFYVITGAHGIHLFGGIAALCYLLIRAAQRPELILFDFTRQRSRLSVTSLYWHFLTLLWLGLFMVLLLWP